MNDPIVLEVTPNSPLTRDHDLNRAVDIAIGHATGRRQGILVTQQSFFHYTVTVTPDVPFGAIHERRIGA